MVKSILYTLAAVILCAALFFLSEWYVRKQFEDFSCALDTLYVKVDEKVATAEDAYAVRQVWNDKKSKLHIFVPHNDISYIDYWLSEACGLLANRHYETALAKIEVLMEITKNLPDAYSVKLENIF